MTKENITIAALRLFLLRGYKYVSLVDIAGEAGITKGGIYHYFGSKEEVLCTALHYLFDRFEAKYQELFSCSQGVREILDTVIAEREMERYTYQLLGIRKGDYRLNFAGLILEVIQNFPEIQGRIDRNHALFCQAIETKLKQAMEQGEIRSDLDSHALAILILTMLNGQNSLGEQLNTPLLRKQMMDNLWQLLDRK
ncbi:tetr bacterial regulatory protein hth signature [Lucifera butyrica]|uniref:Tetr bacterial regulatory protein hth signature n=1 Tax=Lucifera butyrica TaxID=1351585 RepID=A0A498RF58_9FIRM|nr:TetR/AcrR family transcriptional regulator [Lucifera butyrica]VBB09645.1 tetr bacterial regulatory protein hth signature [Lucifera butyrica]